MLFRSYVYIIKDFVKQLNNDKYSKYIKYEQIPTDRQKLKTIQKQIFIEPNLNIIKNTLKSLNQKKLLEQIKFSNNSYNNPSHSQTHNQNKSDEENTTNSNDSSSKNYFKKIFQKNNIDRPIELLDKQISNEKINAQKLESEIKTIKENGKDVEYIID